MRKIFSLLISTLICCATISFNVYAMSADNYESNNTQSSAKTISAGEITASLHNTSDVDYYKFSSSSSRSVTLTLTPTSTTGLTNSELRMELIAPSGDKVYNYVTGTNKRQVSHACINGGTYYLKVYGNKKSTGREYSIDLSISVPNVSIWVETISQDKSQWCWAACAEMAGESYWRPLNNYSKPYRDVTQADIVQEIHGNTDNQAAENIQEVADAQDYVLDISSDYSNGFGSPYDEDEIFECLWTKRQPIIARIGNESEDGHFLLIKAIEYAGDDTCVDVVDPWYGEVVTVGLYELTNEEFTSSDSRIWTHTVETNKTIE